MLKPNEIEVVILAEGDYPTHKLPLSILTQCDKVICCDGAANTYINMGKIPMATIGDGDSINEELKNKLNFIFVPDQETNDLTKAINYAKDLGYKNIAILGATGKRECHTIGNISLLMEYKKMGLNVVMFTDYCSIFPCKDYVCIDSKVGQQISIINFCATNLNSEGLKYPIYDFTALWQGTLNECTAEKCSIKADGEFLVILDYAN
jgi:thiamine pyrophosphokinase